MDFLNRITQGLTVSTSTPPVPSSASRQGSGDSVILDPRKSSFSTFDKDLRNPVSPNRINPNTMFDELNPQTPAGQALKANKDIKYTRFDKFGNKVMKKRVKVKNFTKDIKKSKRRRRSNIKGKKIDGKHEQYTLSLGMMLGIRCCVGKSEQLTSGNRDTVKLNFTGKRGEKKRGSGDLVAVTLLNESLTPFTLRSSLCSSLPVPPSLPHP